MSVAKNVELGCPCIIKKKKKKKKKENKKKKKKKKKGEKKPSLGKTPHPEY